MEHSILIVDDSPMMGKFLTRLFANVYQTVHSTEPTEALQWLKKGLRPSIILLDYEMENINGLDFLSNLQAGSKEWGKIPTLMLSGTKDATLRIAALSKGVDDFVLKPFHPKELEIRVKRILEQHYSSTTT